MIKGAISTCLPEKQHGFIKGEDARDYYFAFKSLNDKSQIEKIAEGALVEFEQRATPRGYRAESISIAEEREVRYSEPAEMLVSRSQSIKGWEVIEIGGWIVHGSSRISPDDAKRNLLNYAKLVGANAVIESGYYKTTGSEQGAGNGTHHYTIHNFRARVVTVAKKDMGGSLSLEGLVGLNQKAEDIKWQYVELNQSNEAANQQKRNLIWSGGVIVVVLLGMGTLFFLAIGAGFLTLLLPLFFQKPTTHGDWLQRV